MEYILGAPAQQSPQWNDSWSDIVETNKAASVDCGSLEIIWEWDENGDGSFQEISNSAVFLNDQDNRQITKV